MRAESVVRDGVVVDNVRRAGGGAVGRVGGRGRYYGVEAREFRELNGCIGFRTVLSYPGQLDIEGGMNGKVEDSDEPYCPTLLEPPVIKIGSSLYFPSPCPTGISKPMPRQIRSPGPNLK